MAVPTATTSNSQNTQGDRRSATILLWVLTTVMALLYIGMALIYIFSKGEADSGLVVILFALPALPAFFFLRIFLEQFPKNLVAFVPLCSIIFQLACLILYTLRDKVIDYLQLAAWISFSLAALLVLLAFLVTPSFLCRAMSASEQVVMGRLPRLLNSIKIDIQFVRDYPFATLSFFLALLCFTAYFIAFSLAFHDQERWLRANTGEPGLYSKLMLWSMDDWTEPERYPSLESVWELQFTQGVSLVETDPDYESSCHKGVNGGADIIVAKLSDEVLQRRVNNSKSLCEIVKALRRFEYRSHIRAVLVGHADTTTAEGRSNLDISLSRIHNVMVEIIKRVQARTWDGHIEWVTIPLSDDRSFLAGNPDNFITVDRSQLSVEVALFPASDDSPPHGPTLDRGRELTLLDYVHYAVYTVSTTGYGDIMPVSAFAKFVSAAANIFEIVFMVVFFNVLTSYLTDRNRDTDNKTQTEGNGTTAAV